MATSVVLLCLLGLAAHASADLLTPHVPFPFTNAQKHQVQTPKSAVVGTGEVLTTNSVGEDNLVLGGYQVITRTSRFSGVSVGDCVDQNGDVVYASTSNFTKGTTVLSSNNPDFITIIPRAEDPAEGRVTKADIFVHFEAPNPASVYHLQVDVNEAGHLTMYDAQPVDFSEYGGVWTPCAGSLTPWGTHLGGEEYEPDARLFWSSNSINSRVRDMARYFGLYLGDFPTPADFMTAVREVMNPYEYGHPFEISINASGVPVATKHYAMGRTAYELPLVMPDRKTAYLADDGADVGFYKFVADTPGDLSKGRIYGAKFTQASAANGGAFNIEWIDLGATDDAILKEQVKITKFADIFDYEAPINGTSCPEGFRGVHTSNGRECLRLRPGKEMHAAALETRRYTAYLGGTTEWTKWEGMTVDSKRMKLYVAMSYLESGVAEEPSRFGGNDHIRLPLNPCGCIYELPLSASYDISSMSGLHCGDPVNGLVPGIAMNNTCNVDDMSNPDNIHYDVDYDLLFLGEDTDGHDNNYLWVRNMDTGEMTRILSSPMGAEVTGVYGYKINGKLYYTANMQHPFDTAPALATVNGSTNRGGWIGYFGPFDVPSGSTIQFQHIAAPTTQSDKIKVVASPKIVMGKRVMNDYKPLLRTGVKYNDRVFGEMYDQDLNPIIDPNTGMPQINNDPDFTAMIGICDRTYLVTGFESPVPNPFDITRVEQNKKTGKIDKVVDSSPIDWGAWGGITYTCAGSVSPWKTRIGSEETDPDAKVLEGVKSLNETTIAQWLPLAKQFGLSGTIQGMLFEQFKDAVRPYRYGFVTQVKVNYDASHTNIKHYTLGRVSAEMGYVMPDRRTVYISADDSNQNPWLKFVADREMDLTAGHLYAAKFHQIHDIDGGEFGVSWIHLGYATQEMLMPLVDTLVFSDIFEAADPVNATCPEGFKGTNNGRGCECLKLKEGMDVAAAFLETRRYAGYAGATTEWSKWEGTTFNPDKNELYVAISVVRSGAEDYKSRGVASGSYDQCGANDVRLPWNRCGCVYKLSTDMQYSAYHMEALICGKPNTNAAAAGYVPQFNCLTESIAEPDNIAYVSSHNALLIGEDTNEQQVDSMWLMDLDTHALTRIMTAPYGAETTSTYWYNNYNGFDYVLGTVQHPYGESDQAKVNETGSFTKSGAVGFVLGPLPTSGKPNPAEDCRQNTWVVDVEFAYSRATFDEFTERYDAYIQAKMEYVLMSVAEVRHAKAVVSSAFTDAEATTITARVSFGSQLQAQRFLDRKDWVQARMTKSLEGLRTSAAAAYGEGTVQGAEPVSFKVGRIGRLRKSIAYVPPQ